MFLPIGDTPNPRGTPYVNYALIAANVAVFLFISLPLIYHRPDLSDPLLGEYLRAMGAQGQVPVRDILLHVSAYDLFTFRYGFRPAHPSFLTLFTAMFLHGGWLHIIGNMLFLWIFGDNVEYRLGRIGYLLTYLGTGVVATLFFALFVPGSDVPLIGASGAISGILGCYFLWFPRNQVKTFVFLFPFIMTTFLIPARWVLGFFLLIDNLLPFLISSGAGGGVAHGAHIGGFLGGLGLAYALDRIPGMRYRWDSRRKTRMKKPGRTDREIPPEQNIARSIREGNLQRAADLYFGLEGREERRRLASEDALGVGDYLLQTGRYDQALSLFRSFIAERPADPNLDRAFLGAGKAMIHQPRSNTSAYHYFLSALDVARTEETAREARGHLRIIERSAEG
jgi:membrane associated rhomboid family serine protease